MEEGATVGEDVVGAVRDTLALSRSLTSPSLSRRREGGPPQGVEGRDGRGGPHAPAGYLREETAALQGPLAH